MSFLVLSLIMECRLLRSIAQQNRDRMNNYLTRLRIAEDKLRLEDYVGGERNLLVLKHFFDLRPTISHHRNTTYSKDRVDAAWTRADQEGWPTPEKIAQVIRKKN